MHYSISLFLYLPRGGGSVYEKVVVTKGIFPSQPLHHSTENRHGTISGLVSTTRQSDVGQTQDSLHVWEVQLFGFPFFTI